MFLIKGWSPWVLYLQSCRDGWPWEGPFVLTLHLSVLLLSLEWLRLSLGAFMCMFFIVGFQRST